MKSQADESKVSISPKLLDPDASLDPSDYLFPDVLSFFFSFFVVVIACENNLTYRCKDNPKSSQFPKLTGNFEV